jgi:hypothetical protein
LLGCTRFFFSKREAKPKLQAQQLWLCLYTSIIKNENILTRLIIAVAAIRVRANRASLVWICQRTSYSSQCIINNCAFGLSAAA